MCILLFAANTAGAQAGKPNGVGQKGTVPVIKLAQLEQRLAHGGDTVFVVNFWATWCKPCVEELPAFDALSREYQMQAVRVLLVSLDDPRQLSAVETFVRRRGFQAEVVLMDEAKPHLWIDRVSEAWSGAIPGTMIYRSADQTKTFFERQFTLNELRSTLETIRKHAP
jgi:thiol-disulfide isomerase/thioredoxin